MRKGRTGIGIRKRNEERKGRRAKEDQECRLKIHD
jgi:hypothetical protein